MDQSDVKLTRNLQLGIKLAKLFQAKTGRTVNRSSIRKICLNKDELLRGLLRQNRFYHFLRKEVVAVNFQNCTPIYKIKRLREFEKKTFKPQIDKI
jgi:hypothetical protein